MASVPTSIALEVTPGAGPGVGRGAPGSRVVCVAALALPHAASAKRQRGTPSENQSPPKAFTHQSPFVPLCVRCHGEPVRTTVGLQSATSTERRNAT